jgi:hypothetical protein
MYILFKKVEGTRNTRDIVEGDRRRVETHVRGIGCPAIITISKHKKMGDQWVLIMNDQEHNQQCASDSTRSGRRGRFYIVDFIVKYTFIGLYTLNYVFTYNLVHGYSDIIKGTRLLRGLYALSRAPLMIGRIPKEVRNALRKCTVPRRLGKVRHQEKVDGFVK